MFTQVMQNPRFMALLQPPPPSQSIGTKKEKSEPVKALAQGSDLQAMQQVFPAPSVHPGYFGGGSVFQSMAGHAPGNQFYTPGIVFGGAQTMMPNPMYGGIGMLPRVRVIWDEANLEYLDANKSPKQKITEPKTPYHVPAQEDGSISPIAGEGRKFLDQAAQAEQIQHALMEVASTSNSQRRVKGGWTSSEDEADDMDQETEDVEMSNRDKSFQEQRKAHYDEYRKLKALRQSKSQQAEEEESQPMEKEEAAFQRDGLGIKNSKGLS
ncbi:hypothetical protein L7F22_023764 [Adiantum nelumboides]|nr:hypothetical protein [Adiantum nelumboides]